MVEYFTLYNLTTQEEISIGQDPKYDYLLKEIDWGNTLASHNTYNYPGQVGVYISSTTLRPRDVLIKGFVSYIPTKQERESMTHSELMMLCHKKIEEKKKCLDRIVNPQDYLRITVGMYYLQGKPNNSILFGKNEEENNEYFCSFTFSLYCAFPLFKKKSQTQVVLNGVTPSFHFPLIIPREGVIMSVRHNYQLIAVENDGAIETGCIIRMKSRGTLSNPKIENVFTGERILINKSLVAGEEIVINTNDGKEKGLWGSINDAESENYFKYWNFDNTWFKIPPGTSLLGYSVDNDLEALLEVTVEISPAKYTLKEL